MGPYSKQMCEFLRVQSAQRFDKVKTWWIDCGRWAAPHRTKRLQGQMEGQRNNHHVVDTTHLLSLRSFTAGFLEGNTSASRPWYRHTHADPDVNRYPENRAWLDKFTRRTLNVLTSSNFYNAAGIFYNDLGTFNTGALYIDELDNKLHFHDLEPGSYTCLNNNLGVADILIRDFSLTVKALVDTYGVKDSKGRWDWSNFSSRVRKFYEDGNYTLKVDIVHICRPNPDFNPSEPIALMNKPWLSLTYEMASQGAGQYYHEGAIGPDPMHDRVFLKQSASKRKPFIVGRSMSSGNFEYGEKGPTLDSLGLIKSLNKKAISKDIAMDLMLSPPTQGPASLRKSYISTRSNAYVPLDAQSAALGGIKPIHQINPAVATINADVSDLRDQVSKHYFADFLLFLTMNPKTRTATETNAVVQEQQLIIGPMLQSMNWTFNDPVIDFVSDYVLDTDATLEPPPDGLQGEFLQTNHISVFAQAQKAADLPSVDRYVQTMLNAAQVQPNLLQKVNLDIYADIYEDRLFLPAGLNNPQSKVDAMREQAQKMQERQQMVENMPGVAGAARDIAAAKASKQQ